MKKPSCLQSGSRSNPGSNEDLKGKLIRLGRKRSIRSVKQDQVLRNSISILASCSKPGRTPKDTLEGQPFDAILLAISPLYRKSRKLFLAEGGRFVPALVSSARTLGAASLLENVIEYSPIEKELCWAATDSIERSNTAHLLRLRTYSSSLFHEQNHRVLNSFLPGPSPENKKLEKYLNFMESLIITLDMALGDELGSELAGLFYQAGVIYDPGTDIKSEIKSSSYQISQGRFYRNYLQAALHATYLNLNFYHPEQIPEMIQILFPNLGEWATRAAERSCRLDREFINQTNLIWQKKHRKKVVEKFSRPGVNPLILSNDPLDHRTQYLWAEKWFDFLGL